MAADVTLDGVGFVFKAGGGVFGLDSDNSRDPDTGELAPEVRDILDKFEGYAEVSPSGFGFKLVARGTLPGDKGRKNSAADLEAYPKGRFFALTGLLLPGRSATITEGTAGLSWVWPQYFPDGVPKSKSKSKTATNAREETRSEWGDTTDTGLTDAEVFDWLFRRDPKAATIVRLWAGDASAYGDDDSSADMALVNHIAYYVGNDAKRIDRLFRESRLRRPKWDAMRGVTTYGARTITRVLATKTDFYTPRWDVTIKGANADGKGTDSRGSSGEQAQPGWGPPAELPKMPHVPPFPVSVFPPKVANYWTASADALACPVDYVAVPGMALLGAAVGRSRAAEVKTGYAEPPLLWTAVFAPPGSTKSAALRAAGAPLHRAEARWIEQNRAAVSIFDTEMDRFTAKMKDWKTAGCEGEPPEKPRRPTLRQAIFDDTTTEAAAKVMNENPRGVIVVKDELIGFVRSMNQYRGGGKGSDREFWLSCWAGTPVKKNRSGTHDDGPLVVPHTFAGFAGMMCPDALPELRGDSRGVAPADGFIDRYLVSFPDPIDAEPETWKVVPEHLEQGYCEVFTDLLGVEMIPVADGPEVTSYRPYFIPLSPDGRAAWGEFTGKIAAKMNALDKLDPFRGVLSKLKGYCARIAALLWAVRRACNELEPNAPIGADIIAGASKLVDYFEAHAIRCHGRGWADRPIRVATRLIRWLMKNPQICGFNRTEAFLQLKDKRDVQSADALAPAFKILVDHNYIRPLDRPENARPGPVPETYAINPSWNRTPPE